MMACHYRSLFINTAFILWSFHLSVDASKPADDTALMNGASRDLPPISLPYGQGEVEGDDGAIGCCGELFSRRYRGSNYISNDIICSREWSDAPLGSQLLKHKATNPIYCTDAELHSCL